MRTISRFTFLLAFTFLSYPALFSQDILLLQSGEELQVKITEIGQNTVKYKKWSNPDGPAYTITKADVFKITYKNGTHEVFNKISAPSTTVTPTPIPKNQPISSSVNNSSNILAFGPVFSTDGSDFYFGGELSYEFKTKKNNLGIRITTVPLFSEYEGLVSISNLVIWKFYLGSGSTKFIIGPGIFSGFDFDYEVPYVGAGGMIGASFDLSDKLNLTLHTNDGIVVDGDGDVYPVALVGISIGFRL